MGIAIRDHKFFVVLAKSIKILKGKNNIMEAQTLLHGLQLAYDLKIKVLEIEGDSLIIVNACKEINLFCWKIRYVMQQV